VKELLLMAVEATEDGGGLELSSVVIVTMIVALAAFAIAYLVVGPGRRKEGAKRMGDIPLAMRPYHSDEELETTGLERAMAWGVALAMFSAVFVAVYWAIEPERIDNRQTEFYVESVAQGRTLYQANCASCHGVDLRGGSAPNPYDSDAPWPAPAMDNIQARFADSDIVSDIEEFLTVTIKQGRPGTPMPAWGAAYLGPMNDLEVQSIVDYILALQTGEIPDAQAFTGAMASGEAVWMNNCATCHAPDLSGRVGPQLLNFYERYGWRPGNDAIRAAVDNTLRGTIVNGRYVPGAGIMPPFRNTLTDEAIEAVIEFIYEQQVTGGPRYGQVGGDPVRDGD
jgi:mono/diheme cytochrome c family protein